MSIKHMNKSIQTCSTYEHAHTVINDSLLMKLRIANKSLSKI